MGYVGLLMQSFKKGRKTYTQVKRKGVVAMYMVEDGGHTYYEVFKIRQKRGVWVEIDGVKFKSGGGECYPSPKEFGKLAYSCHDLERAEFRFKDIQRRVGDSLI